MNGQWNPKTAATGPKPRADTDCPRRNRPEKAFRKILRETRTRRSFALVTGLSLVWAGAARLESLIGQMTLAEKIAQLQNAAPRIPRMGVPAYN